MADKQIGELPAIESLSDDSLFVAEQNGEAGKVSGAQIKAIAKAGAKEQTELAEAAAVRAENAAVHQPVIKGGTWWVWNPETGVYEDTKISATGSGSGSGSASDAVQYIEQTLTEEQQIQARTNINALGADELPAAVEDALVQAKASGEFDGKDGESVTVLDVRESYEDGGVNTVWFSNGKYLEVRNGNAGRDGTDGINGKNGYDGADGKDGYTPVKGVDYFDGQDGTSVTVQSVTESTEDGGSNVVTFSDGKTLTVRNGKTGSAGSGGSGGDSGIHVGSDEPDSSANVWIDPSAGATNTEEWLFTLTDGTEVKRTVFLG